MVAVIAAKARLNLLDFCQLTFPGYQRADHLVRLAEKLEAVERGDITRLMVFMPPRHGKSELCSIRFPAWYIGRNPNNSVILASYAASLAQKFSKRIRNLADTAPYRLAFPGVALAQDSRSAQQWNIAGKQGGLRAAGVGGGITGHGAHLLLIDDPVKSVREAESTYFRQALWDWYSHDAFTRLEDNGCVCLTMTRWHKDDLAGRLLQASEEEWEILKLPAWDEAYERSLWPAKYPPAAMTEIKRSVGTRAWLALYQQEPAAPEGTLIKRDWIRWYNATDSDDLMGGQIADDTEAPKYWYAGVDTATSRKARSHDSALAETGRDERGRLYTDRVHAGKFSVRQLAELVCLRHQVRAMQTVKIEENNAGEAIKQRVIEVGMETRAYPPVIGEVVSQDKTTRLIPITPLVEAGVIVFNRRDPGVVKLVEHLVAFVPGDDFDDVDAWVHSVTAARFTLPCDAGVEGSVDTYHAKRSSLTGLASGSAVMTRRRTHAKL